MAKFSDRSVTLYGVKQVSEGNSAVKAVGACPGTLTTTLGSAAVTGVGTTFLTTLTPNGYIYTAAGLIIGQVLSIASDTAATLVDTVAAAVPQSSGVMGTAGPVTASTFQTGLGPKNALKVLDLNTSIELETEAFRYTGDETDRSEETVIKDRYSKFDFSVFMPCLGTIAGTDPTIAEVPLVDWLQSVDGSIVLSTGSNGYANATNTVVSNTFLTVEIRRSSPDLTIPNTQKVHTVTDVRGTLDIDAAVGTRVKLKFNYMGNLQSVSDKLLFVPDYGTQAIDIAPSFSSKTITLSALAVYTSQSQPAIPGSSNVCFDKLTAPSAFGYEFGRYLTGCADGWSKQATPTDVNITILEDKATATYNPDDNLETNHLLICRWGSVAGKRVEILFTKVQLANIAHSTIASYSGQDLKFRNTGNITIKLS